MNWFRWYTGTATDPKFLVVARLAGQNVAAVVAVWAMLLERASDAGERDRTQTNAREEENRILNTHTPESKDSSVCVAQKSRKPSSSEVLIGKRKRLEGKRKQSFETFWETFAYKKGRAEAIDAWAAIPQLTDALMEQILSAARKEAERRQEIVSAGRTPIYAQGWISGRRWEDEELSEAPRRRPEYLTNPNFGR